MKVQFEAGDGMNFMKSEDGRFYAEVKVPHDIIDEYGDRISPFSEDYGYMALKKALSRLSPELEFPYDGQEMYLSEDAFVDVDVEVEDNENI